MSLVDLGEGGGVTRGNMCQTVALSFHCKNEYTSVPFDFSVFVMVTRVLKDRPVIRPHFQSRYRLPVTCPSHRNLEEVHELSPYLWPESVDVYSGTPLKTDGVSSSPLPPHYCISHLVSREHPLVGYRQQQ